MTSTAVTDLLRGLVASMAGTEVRPNDAVLAPGIEAAAAMQSMMADLPNAPTVVVDADALPPHGRVFAFFEAEEIAGDSWWMQVLANQGRLALLAWPRNTTAPRDHHALGLLRSLGLDPLMPASVDTATHDDLVYAGMIMALNEPIELVEPSASDYAISPADWAAAARAYLSLGLRQAATAAAQRAGASNDRLLELIDRQSRLDTALATALEGSATALLPVMTAGSRLRPIPLVPSTIQDFQSAQFAELLDDEVIGPGVHRMLREFILTCFTPTSAFLDLSPAHGHVVFALSQESVASGRVVAVEGNASRCEALTSAAQALGDSAPHILRSVSDAAAMVSSASRILVHATLPGLRSGVVEGLVPWLRERDGDFAIVVSGLTMAVAEQDPTVRAMQSVADRLGLTVRGVVRDPPQQFAALALSDAVRPQLLFVC